MSFKSVVSTNDAITTMRLNIIKKKNPCSILEAFISVSSMTHYSSDTCNIFFDEEEASPNIKVAA